MKVHTCTNQGECREVLRITGTREVFQPLPTTTIADGIIQLDGTTWLVGTNDRSFYTLHLLEDCTREEAFDFFDSLHGGCGHCDPRITFAGQAASTAAQN